MPEAKAASRRAERSGDLYRVRQQHHDLLGHGRPKTLRERQRAGMCLLIACLRTSSYFSLSRLWDSQLVPEKEKGKTEREKWITEKSRYLFGSCKGNKKTVYQSVSLGSYLYVNLAIVRLSKALLLQSMARVQPEMWTMDSSAVI